MIVIILASEVVLLGLISPGGQTIAMSREMDEFFGGYAHLYSFDFEMLNITDK